MLLNRTINSFLLNLNTIFSIRSIININLNLSRLAHYKLVYIMRIPCSIQNLCDSSLSQYLSFVTVCPSVVSLVCLDFMLSRQFAASPGRIAQFAGLAVSSRDHTTWYSMCDFYAPPGGVPHLLSSSSSVLLSVLDVCVCVHARLSVGNFIHSCKSN